MAGYGHRAGQPMSKDLIATPYQIIYPDAETPVIEQSIDWPKAPLLDDMSRLFRDTIKGQAGNYSGYLERVNVWHSGRYTDMLVDEEGSLRRLPENPRATAIYHANELHHRFGDPPEHDRARITAGWPLIYGVAVLFSRRIWY
jgi:hypothetical protein